MLRILIISFLCVCSIHTFGQQYPEIAGARFGWTYEACKEVLDDSLNEGQPSTQLSKDYRTKLTYHMVQYEGYQYLSAFYNFEPYGNTTFLTDIILMDIWDISELDQAKVKQKSIAEAYKRDYDTFIKSVDDAGFDIYFIENDKDPFMIAISLSTGESQDGITRIFLSVMFALKEKPLHPLNEI